MIKNGIGRGQLILGAFGRVCAGWPVVVEDEQFGFGAGNGGERPGHTDLWDEETVGGDKLLGVVDSWRIHRAQSWDEDRPELGWALGQKNVEKGERAEGDGAKGRDGETRRLSVGDGTPGGNGIAIMIGHRSPSGHVYERRRERRSR